MSFLDDLYSGKGGDEKKPDTPVDDKKPEAKKGFLDKLYADKGEPPGLLKSAGAGAVKGLGGIGDTREALFNVYSSAAKKLGIDIPEPVQKGLGIAARGVGLGPALDAPTSAQTTKAAETVTGAPLPKPQTTGENIVASATEALTNPLSYVGGGSLASKAATAISGGVGSEVFGQLLKGDSNESYARIIGGFLGGGLPAAGARAITPIKQLPGRAAQVAKLEAEGVRPTAGDVTGSRALQRAESSLGSAPGAGGAYERAQQKVSEDYTRAALARVGETATEITPPTVNRIFNRIGNQFAALGARNKATFDTPFMNDMFKTLQDYDHLFTDPLHAASVRHVFESTLNYLRGARDLSGAQYNAFRSKIGRMLRGTQEPQVKEFMGSVQDALDSMMERSIVKTNPADAGAFKEVRNQYRNALVLERIASGAGAEAASGQISPAKLRQSTVAVQGRRNYAQGKGDFSDLAHAGYEVMGNRPVSSGTAERGLIHAFPMVALGTAGYMLGHPGEGVGAGQLAGLAGPGLAGRAIMSPVAQAYLKNQLVKGKPFRGGSVRSFQEALAKELSKYYAGQQQ